MSGSSSSASVTVFAPPSVPSISSVSGATPSTNATVSGHGLAGATVELYESGALVGSAAASSSGSWTATLSLLSGGKHTLAARQQDPATGFWSALGSTFQVTVNPDAPFILAISTRSSSTTGAR